MATPISHEAIQSVMRNRTEVSGFMAGLPAFEQQQRLLGRSADADEASRVALERGFAEQHEINRKMLDALKALGKDAHETLKATKQRHDMRDPKTGQYVGKTSSVIQDYYRDLVKARLARPGQAVRNAIDSRVRKMRGKVERAAWMLADSLTRPIEDAFDRAVADLRSARRLDTMRRNLRARADRATRTRPTVVPPPLPPAAIRRLAQQPAFWPQRGTPQWNMWAAAMHSPMGVMGASIPGAPGTIARPATPPPLPSSSDNGWLSTLTSTAGGAWAGSRIAQSGGVWAAARSMLGGAARIGGRALSFAGKGGLYGLIGYTVLSRIYDALSTSNAALSSRTRSQLESQSENMVERTATGMMQTVVAWLATDVLTRQNLKNRLSDAAATIGDMFSRLGRSVSETVGGLLFGTPGAPPSGGGGGTAPGGGSAAPQFGVPRSMTPQGFSGYMGGGPGGGLGFGIQSPQALSRRPAFPGAAPVPSGGGNPASGVGGMTSPGRPSPMSGGATTSGMPPGYAFSGVNTGPDGPISSLADIEARRRGTVTVDGRTWARPPMPGVPIGQGNAPDGGPMWPGFYMGNDGHVWRIPQGWQPGMPTPQAVPPGAAASPSGSIGSGTAAASGSAAPFGGNQWLNAIGATSVGGQVAAGMGPPGGGGSVGATPLNRRMVNRGGSQHGAMISRVVSGYGFDPATMMAIAGVENGGNAHGSTGSYMGLFQIGRDYLRGNEDPFNPEDNTNAAMRAFSRRRNSFLRSFGREPTPTELYLMHQQGDAGGPALMRNPDAPAVSTLSRWHGGNAARAVWGNVPSDLQHLFPGGPSSITGRQFAAIWAHRLQGIPYEQALAMSQANNVFGSGTAVLGQGTATTAAPPGAGNALMQGGPQAATPNGRIFPIGGSQAGRTIFDVPMGGGSPRSREFGLGVRNGGARNHAGLDIPGRTGDPIMAMRPGVVVAAGNGSGYGNYIDVMYDGDGGRIHRMAHNRGAAFFQRGQRFNAGDTLAHVGHTGNATADFPHVHYEIFNSQAAYRNAQGVGSTAGLAFRQDPRQWFIQNHQANMAAMTGQGQGQGQAMSPGALPGTMLDSASSFGLGQGGARVPTIAGFPASPLGTTVQPITPLAARSITAYAGMGNAGSTAAGGSVTGGLPISGFIPPTPLPGLFPPPNASMFSDSSLNGASAAFPTAIGDLRAMAAAQAAAAADEERLGKIDGPKAVDMADAVGQAVGDAVAQGQSPPDGGQNAADVDIRTIKTTDELQMTMINAGEDY